MVYVIPVIVVVLAIAGFLVFVVFRATDKGAPEADGRGADATPVGDTSEHAGEQTEAGTTVGKQDASQAGGTGRPVHSGPAETTGAGEDATNPDAAAHVARPGEGEGSESLDFEGERPPDRGGSRTAG